MFTRGVLAAVAAGGLAIGLVPSVADATPSSGVTATIISKSTIGRTDYVLREITIQPGGTTGWHFHDGTLYAFVKAGMLTHSGSNCKTDGVYRAGAAFTEPSGSDHVHVGRNLGPKPLVLDVLYVLPTGSPLSEDAPNPGCPFQ
ncbi:cupin domain-containing protein [Kribbella jejuensis]|uniref:Quercetin dioxygenase-like cupin family protein n=1 Tax=Kribbella jejuensis TaxID=236068 RepID=A0A542DS49_9ACTN|nr:cupin domain-containing protein [Kribbella jejuensis]TQJ05957.1 quercetin dioxygenase-like cupin family protein [Kribbella jejuensis]